jgi:TfoX/Sxy family transcriptional regulator of competence genes
MAYSEQLAERMRAVIGTRDAVTERRMFGGIVWLVDGNMAVGTFGEDMMVRLSPEDAAEAIARPQVVPMEMRGRPMRGFVVVRAAGIEDDADLAHWIDEGAAFATSLPPK